MPLFVRDEDVAGPGKDTQTINGQGGAMPAGRFLTRNSTLGRKKQVATLISAIHVMEVNLNLENFHVHEITSNTKPTTR
jgi:hypothetical protein